MEPCYQCAIEQQHGGALMFIKYCPLHAAAQDLLEALRLLVDADDGQDDRSVYWQKRDHALAMTRSAIKKAAG